MSLNIIQKIIMESMKKRSFIRLIKLGYLCQINFLKSNSTYNKLSNHFISPKKYGYGGVPKRNLLKKLANFSLITCRHKHYSAHPLNKIERPIKYFKSPTMDSAKGLYFNQQIKETICTNLNNKIYKISNDGFLNTSKSSLRSYQNFHSFSISSKGNKHQFKINNSHETSPIVQSLRNDLLDINAIVAFKYPKNQKINSLFSNFIKSHIKSNRKFSKNLNSPDNFLKRKSSLPPVQYDRVKSDLSSEKSHLISMSGLANSVKKYKTINMSKELFPKRNNDMCSIKDVLLDIKLIKRSNNNKHIEQYDKFFKGNNMLLSIKFPSKLKKSLNNLRNDDSNSFLQTTKKLIGKFTDKKNKQRSDIEEDLKYKLPNIKNVAPSRNTSEDYDDKSKKPKVDNYKPLSELIRHFSFKSLNNVKSIKDNAFNFDNRNYLTSIVSKSKSNTLRPVYP